MLSMQMPRGSGREIPCRMQYGFTRTIDQRVSFIGTFSSASEQGGSKWVLRQFNAGTACLYLDVAP